MTSNNPNRPLSCLVRSILILAVLSVSAICLLVGVGIYLSRGDAVRSVDALVVLSGDEGDRVRMAAQLYEDRVGNYVVITKTDNEDIGEQRTYSQKLMRIAITEGVPQDAILFTDGFAGNTIDEARATLKLSRERNLNSLLVVTGPYHVRRTRMIFRHVFAEEGIKIRVMGVSDSWYRPTTWFLHVRGWQQTISELAGIIAFKINPDY